MSRPSLRLVLVLTVAASLVLLPAQSAAETTTVTVSNSAPTVTSVSLPGSTINPTSGSTTSVASTIVVADLNGCSDISSVTVQVLKPDGTSHIAASAATYSSCASGTDATYTHSFNMNYYDAAALLTNQYKVKVVATDSAGATGDNTASLSVFNYAELAALNLNLSSVNFGSSIAPNSTTSIQSVGVQNYGNVQIDVQVSGTDLSHATAAASIGVAKLAYSTASNMSGSAALSGTSTTLSAFDLAKGSASSKPLYMQLSVPSGDTQWIPSGTYTGTLTVSAVAG